jgi:hypothetical protein
MSEMYAIVYNDDEHGYPVMGKPVSLSQDYYEDVEEDDELSLNTLMADEIGAEDESWLD